MVHKTELVADVVDRVDNIVELGKVKLVDAAAGDQVVDRVAIALRVDRENALPQGFHLGLAEGLFKRVNLTVGIADIDVVMIDQRDMADARARTGFGRPGTDPANTNNAEMGARECRQGRFPEYPAYPGETICVGLTGQRFLRDQF